MKTAFLLLPLMLFNAEILVAQSLRYSVAHPYIGLSAYSNQQNDALSFTGNQAALAKTKFAGAGVYGERRFILKETGTYTLGMSLPTRLGNLGLQMTYSGFKNFNESKIGLAYARSLGKVIDVGVQFYYYGYRVPAYGNAATINFEVGVLMHVTEKLSAGIHVYNPVGGKLGKENEEKLASAYKAGLGYDASDKFFISTEIIKEEDKPVNITAGLQYHFAKQFFARAGVMSESATMYAGAGVSWKNLRLDVTTSYHPQLGFSPGMLLIINFKKNAE